MSKLITQELGMAEAVKRITNDGILGSVMAIIFVTEYLALGNTAVRALGSPQLLAEGGSRSLVAVIVAVLFGVLFSRLHNNLTGPRITPIIIFGLLLDHVRTIDVVAHQGAMGILAFAGGMLAVSGACQVLMALLKKAQWVNSWISAPLLGAILFAGALSTVVSSTTKLLSCGPDGVLSALVIAATVVITSQVVRGIASASKPQVAALGVPLGMIVGSALYYIWWQLAAGHGLCKGVGVPASTAAQILKPGMPSQVWEIFLNPLVLAWLVLGGITVGLFSMIDTLTTVSALEETEFQGAHIDLNRELMVTGAANIVCGALMLMPVAVSLSRSQPTMKAAKGQRIAQIFHVLTLMVILFFAMPLAAKIPVAVLAGCMVTIALDMINRDTRTLFGLSLKSVEQVPAIGGGLVIFIAVITASLVSGQVFIGFLVGFAMTLLAYFRTAHRGKWHMELKDDKLTITVTGALLFRHAPQFLREAKGQLHQVTHLAEVHLDISGLNRIDFHAANALATVVTMAQASGTPTTVNGLDARRSGGDILKVCMPENLIRR
jgi:ABC-type transporter Mla MlaB component